ncbi:MAG: ATP-binding cassette domain-containing protein [Thermoleophilia bacterium]
MTSLAEFHDLGKRYGSAAVVAGLSFDVPEGAVTGLLGPNGAGKTTSIRMLLGLARPTSGSVTLLGARPGSPGFASAVRQVGALIEGPALYARATARDNMRIEAAARGIERADGQIEELLRFVGLADAARRRAGTFSLGMKQRLGLAQTLLGRPRLVVLDEPTNGLDPAGIVEIRELIRGLPERGTAVLVSSHLLAEVQLMCDRAVIIDRGRFVTGGTIDELRAGYGGGFTVGIGPASADAAVAALAGAGLAALPQPDGRLLVTGEIEDGAAISRPLAEAGIYVTELAERSASLEEVFLALTGDHDGGASAPQEVTS